MRLLGKLFTCAAICALATAAMAQAPSTKSNADSTAGLSQGPYFAVGPQFPVPIARQPAARPPQAATAQPAAPAGPPTGGGSRSFGTEENAPLLWEEHWTRAELTQPMEQKNLGNQNLTLHIYGDAAGIRKTQHPNEDYTYTGETRSNWAITVSDAKNYWDLRSPGKILLRTRNTGFRETHIIIKTADGKYFASEEGSGESSAWMNRDYILEDLHWRNLTMVDAPSNVVASIRPVDKARAVIVATSVAKPDLSKVEEVGFSDLMEGGFIPATTRVNAWALFGKKVPR